MIRNIFFALTVLTLSIGSAFAQGDIPNPIIDSDMSWEEAFVNLHPECPDEIKDRQELMQIYYYSMDGSVHLGQLVLDERLVDDVRQVFDLAYSLRFPITSIIPVSDPRFLKDGRWNDDLSMAANNTSAFNYRAVTGGKKLSNHSYGWAIDINPALNPYIKNEKVLPPGSTYDANVPGTLTESHPIVQKFLELGWEWGGHWTSLKDYQHFEKVLQ